MIRGAPISFCVFLGLVGIGIYGVLNWYYASQIENLESRMALKDDRISEYERKLSGASPDEAKARIDEANVRIKELEERLVKLEPKRLTQEQVTAIRDQLVTVEPASVEIATDLAVPGLDHLANGLAAAFRQAGWQVQRAEVLGISNPPPSGIGLQVKSLIDPSAQERAVIKALEASGLAFDRSGNLRNDEYNFNRVARIAVTTPVH